MILRDFPFLFGVLKSIFLCFAGSGLFFSSLLHFSLLHFFSFSLFSFLCMSNWDTRLKFVHYDIGPVQLVGWLTMSFIKENK